MCFDMVETIKSLATPTKRGNWIIRYEDQTTRQTKEVTDAYTVEGLNRLSKDWDTISHMDKTNLLVPILLRRTADTEIDGVNIMPNYMEKLVEDSVGEIQYDELADEIQARDKILSDVLAGHGQGGTQRYTLARWMSYSSWVVTKNWGTLGREDGRWWNGFTMKNAEEDERG